MVKNITTLIKAAEYLDHRDRGELSRLFANLRWHVVLPWTRMPRNGASFVWRKPVVVNLFGLCAPLADS